MPAIKSAVAAVAADVIKTASKAESAYVAELAGLLVASDTAGKAIMLAVHGLATKSGAKRAAELALFAFESAYPAGIPKQRLSQVKQFCAMPEAQRAELCNRYGTIGLAAINRATVSPTGVYTAPVKVAKAPKVNAGAAKDAGGTPMHAAPATVLASVATMLRSIEAGKLSKAQGVVLASILADIGDLASMLK